MWGLVVYFINEIFVFTANLLNFLVCVQYEQSLRTRLSTVCYHQSRTVNHGSPVSTQKRSCEHLRYIICVVASMEAYFKVGWPAPLLGSVVQELWWLQGILKLSFSRRFSISPACIGIGISSISPVDFSVRMEISKEDQDTQEGICNNWWHCQAIQFYLKS